MFGTGNVWLQWSAGSPSRGRRTGLLGYLEPQPPAHITQTRTTHMHAHKHKHTHTYAQTEDIKVKMTNIDDEKCDVTVDFRFPLVLDCR